MFVTILSAVLIAFTPAGVGPQSAPVLLGGGGPDTYGYTYLDSDTTCPGSPTYNWVDIKGNGTEITTLGDDNYVGPFPIGFEFPYYWYRANSVYIGSNGYITFTRGGLNASPFNPIPSTQQTNNTVAPLCSDLDCSSGGSPNGSVWYKATADSFIVEWDSITFWSTGGNNSFQIILSKPDSTITFQYKEQSGAPYNGWAPTSNQTGIENVSGAIGLNYLSGTVPPGNMYHAALAVKFIPPESTTLQIHDVGILNTMNDRNGGFFTPNTRPLTMWANVKNFGNQPESSFKTYFKITRQTGSQVFFDSLVSGVLAPGQAESLHLTAQWWPSTNGVYYFRSYTKMTGDMLGANDTATLECRVVTRPFALAYDGGTPGSYMSWNGPGGFGNRFVSPVYPCSVGSYKINMQATTATDCYMGLFDDDGPSGSPGTVLFMDTVSVTAANWYTVTPPTPIVIADGAFFVCGTSIVSSSPSFGMDSIPPLSYQGWEFTGVWAPSRDAPMRDVCANATVTGLVGMYEELEPTAPPVPARIDVNPNPFGTSTTIRLLAPLGNETAIELYDATGSVVRTLALSRGTAQLDGRLLADGIYFARVAGSDSPVAKVIVAH
jgi:hypothetical protein